MHRFDIEKDTRIVIQSKEDDFGVLCLQVKSESKHLVHSDGRTAAKMVLKGDQVVVLPPPRQPANSSSNNNSRTTTTNSRARAR